MSDLKKKMQAAFPVGRRGCYLQLQVSNNKKNNKIVLRKNTKNLFQKNVQCNPKHPALLAIWAMV